jgi:hypothetical protein
MEAGELLYLLDRAYAELAVADSKASWNIKLADLIERIGEMIERDAPAGTSAPVQEAIIGKLAEAIRAGYQVVPHAAVQQGKQQLDYLLIMGGDYISDSLSVAKVSAEVSPTDLRRLLDERLKWPRCRTRPEAVKRLMKCLALSRSAAEFRVTSVCETFSLHLDPGQKFGPSKEGGTSLA